MAATSSSTTTTTTTDAIIELDGSILEGGGQIIRNSFAMSSLLHRPIHISKVRGNRAKPGLHAQHLAGVVATAMLHGSTSGEDDDVIHGARLQSSDLLYRPKSLVVPPSNDLHVEIGTAGAIGLIAQIVVPCMVFAPQPLTLSVTGGTHVMMAPSCSFIRDVLAPTLKQRVGVDLSCIIEKNGFYPRGGGSAVFRVTPLLRNAPIKAFSMLDRGEITSITINAYVSRIPMHVAQREAATAEQIIRQTVAEEIEITVNTTDVTRDSIGPGTWIDILARTSTGCLFSGNAVGERKKRAEEVGREAAEHLIKDLREGGCCDEYIQDQMLIFMALAEGESVMKVGEISLHTQTGMLIAEKVAGCKFTVEPSTDKDHPALHIIHCKGIGFRP